jgi:hypothetical protein
LAVAMQASSWSLRMIWSENRFPLFGIMRWWRQST